MRNKRLREPRAHFTAVWEFHVRAEKRRAFEKAYGPKGDWARLFRRAEAYIRTELFRDPNRTDRYVTLDFWTSRLAFQKFKEQHIAAYKSLDQRCQSLTTSEKRIGEFARAVPRNLIYSAASSQCRIRLATAADLESIVVLAKQSPSAAHWNVNSYREIFCDNAPRRIAVVSETADGLLNGFLVARFETGDCELENIVVAEHVLRQGIGFQLLQKLRSTAAELGVKQMLLEVRESNRAARRLYEKAGFQISGRRRSYYQHPPESAVLYTLKL